MKRILVFFILLIVAVTACSEEKVIEVAEKIVPGKHYTMEEVKALEDYTTLYDISITGRQLLILGTKLPEGEEDNNEWFEKNKMVVLNDSKGNFLDAIGIYRADYTYTGSTFINETSICIRADFHGAPPPSSRIVYVNQFSDSIRLFEVPKFVADVFANDDYIIYSTEWGDDSIWRISIATGETIPYKGYYPNADLYPLTDDQYIGYFEHFLHEGQQFVLTDTEIKEAEKNYPPVTVQRLDAFVCE